MKISRGDVALHVQSSGPDDAPAVVFANALGTDLRIWNDVLPLLPQGLRLIRYDLRGHGRSDVLDGPYTMGQMVADAEAVCEALAVKDSMVVGLSVGGMVAQGLAVKRPDLIRTMVLSNTAAKIGNAKLWQDRIAAVEAQGLPALSDTILQRWFGPRFRDNPASEALRAMIAQTSAVGYAGVCAAIAGTDFYTPTAGLRLPTLGVACAEDRAVPPDLVRETIDLIPGSQFSLMRRVGHLPCIEDPAGFAALLNEFIKNTGHI